MVRVSTAECHGDLFSNNEATVQGRRSGAKAHGKIKRWILAGRSSVKRFKKTWIHMAPSWIHDARNLLKGMVKSGIPLGGPR
jgi:hypothetical protein